MRPSTAHLLFGVAIVAGALASALPAAAQSRERTRDRTRERERDTYESRIDTIVALDHGGTVDLSNISGPISVTGWDREDVRVRAYSEEGRLRFDATAARVTLAVDSYRGNSTETRYDVQVPAGARVVVVSTSGELSLRGVRGEVEAHNTSGSIDIDDATARVIFESLSGSVRASRVQGTLRGSSVSGQVTLDRVTGAVEVETVSGEISLREVRSQSVRAESVSGMIEYDGTAEPSGRYEFGSHSGSVRMTLPEDLGAMFRVETFSGAIESDFPITLQPGEQGIGFSHPTRFEFKLGAGGARISAESFSGDIIIRRRGGRGDKGD